MYDIITPVYIDILMQYNVSTFFGGEGVWFNLKFLNITVYLNINVTRAKTPFFIPLEEQANRLKYMCL